MHCVKSDAREKKNKTIILTASNTRKKEKFTPHSHSGLFIALLQFSPQEKRHRFCAIRIGKCLPLGASIAVSSEVNFASKPTSESPPRKGSQEGHLELRCNEKNIRRSRKLVGGRKIRPPGSAFDPSHPTPERSNYLWKTTESEFRFLFWTGEY